MNLYDETFFDHLTPLNVVTGAVARYRGSDVGQMLILAAAFEVIENGAYHYLRDYLPPRNPTVNVLVGVMATMTGWWLADLAINDMNRATR